MWEAYKEEKTLRLYYVNREDGSKSWHPPTSPADLISPFPQEDILNNWQAFYSPQHNSELFFLNALTQECTWIRPAGFLGMPNSEPNCNEETGDFVHYQDASGAEYYYCPLTKLCTRSRPKSVVSEEKAYSDLKQRGLLWEGPAAASVATPISSSSSSGEDEEESSEDGGDAEEEERKQAFFELLRAQGVTHVSRWANWLPKLARIPAFANTPGEQSRTWFEQYIKQCMQSDSHQRAALLAKAKAMLGNDPNALLLETQQALQALKPADRELLMKQLK